MILGNGSNVLFSDEKYNNVIICLDLLNDLNINKTTIIVGAGYKLIKLSNEVSKLGLSGLEFACGIPGSVGGAIFMNAGAYASSMQEIVKEIKVITPNFEIKTIKSKDINFDYRTSILKSEKKYICVEVTLELKYGDIETIKSIIKERIKKRQDSQPIEYPNAGSVFRNPEGNYAGKLIDDLGLKGYTIGGAQISEKHANFIINKNHATAYDIKNLIEFIQSQIKEKYNIDLKLEQELINF
jgi:UDP-N-acetylmuramate dehydrogenase